MRISVIRIISGKILHPPQKRRRRLRDPHTILLFSVSPRLRGGFYPAGCAVAFFGSPESSAPLVQIFFP